MAVILIIRTSEMGNVAIVLLFVGVLMVLSAVHEQRVRELKENKQIQYRFIPRSIYDEQMSTAVSSLYKNMFVEKDVTAT